MGKAKLDQAKPHQAKPDQAKLDQAMLEQAKPLHASLIKPSSFKPRLDFNPNEMEARRGEGGGTAHLLYKEFCNFTHTLMG